MKRLQSIVVREFVVIGLVFLIAALIAGWKLGWGQDDEETAGPKATESPVLTMRTNGVEKSIRDRLGARYGREIVAECPDEVEQTVGTKFECDVYFKNDDTTRTVAKVTMSGGGGQFKWTTEDAPSEDSDEGE